jgi:5'-3' exonuclease
MKLSDVWVINNQDIESSADTLKNANPVLIVDGSYLLHRVKYSAFAHECNAYTFLFMKTLLGSFTALRGFSLNQFSEIFVLWDHGKSKFRSSVFPMYKTRKYTDTDAMREAYSASRQLLHETLPGLGIYSILCSGYEADDFAYYITQEFAPEKDYVMITEDNDWQAFLKPDSVLYKPKKNELYTWEHFAETYGKCPQQAFRIFKALVGDSSDTIPGVRGIAKNRGLPLALALSEDKSIEYLKGASHYYQEKHIFDRNYQLVGFDFTKGDTTILEHITQSIAKTIPLSGNAWVSFCELIQSEFLLSEYTIISEALNLNLVKEAYHD